MTKKKKSNTLKKIFLTGLFTLLPVIVTAFLFMWLINLVDSWAKEPFENMFGYYIPGFGLILSVLLIFIVGLIVSNVFGKKILNFFDRVMSKVPIVKTIYNTIKDLTFTISNKSSSSFKKVCLIQFPDIKTRSIALITNEELIVDGKKQIALFIPTTPNPTNGFLVLVNEEDIQVIDMSVDVALKMIMSMTTLTKKEIKTKIE